jgi:hypothetical protein
MRPGGTSIAASVGVLTLIGATTAQASGPDCRRIPVYSAPCFSQTKPHPGCNAIPYAKAPCFVVHGILQGGNGAPAVRLWRSGTKRVLGIVGGDGDPAAADLIPEPLNTQMTTGTVGWLRSVDADFRVCPLAAARVGWMQPVCLVGATHVVFTRRHYGSDPASAEPPPTPAGPGGSGSPPAPG